MKLAVCIPWSSPFVFTGFWDGNCNMQHPPGCEVRWFRGSGWCPARRHNHFCEQAMDWGADRIVIVGADQVHPEDMLCKLMKRMDEGCEIISALVPFRGYQRNQGMKPFQPIAWRLKANDDGVIVLGPEVKTITMEMLEAIDPEDGDLQRVHFIGSGVVGFRRDHLLSLKRPWFFEKVEPKTFLRSPNQDSQFIWRLQHECNANAWVDTTIKVKHLNVFEIDDTYQNRFDDWMNNGSGDPQLCSPPVYEPHRTPASVTDTTEMVPA